LAHDQEDEKGALQLGQSSLCWILRGVFTPVHINFWLNCDICQLLFHPTDLIGAYRNLAFRGRNFGEKRGEGLDEVEKPDWYELATSSEGGRNTYDQT
jgi:hypothetical protein